MAGEDKDDDKSKEPDLKIVGDGAPEPEDPPEELDKDQDEDDEGGEEESRLGASEDDDDDKGERRRNERKERKERQRLARDRTDRELKLLRTRNETLERRYSQDMAVVARRLGAQDIAQIDTAAESIKKVIRDADKVMADALAAQDGDSFVKAQRIRDEQRDKLRDLNYARGQVEAAHQEQEGENRERSPQQRQQKTDPEVIRHAKKFMDAHKWWDAAGDDEDSLIVSALDTALARQGYDPSDEEYWEELEKRVKARLPHRFKKTEADRDDDDEPQPRRRSKPPTFSVNGQERPLKKNEVHISKERREAMEVAGVWDDPKERARYLASYAKYDREAAQQR